jgi:uncharacterized protein YuzE
MKIEYDSTHDLLYVWFRVPGEKAFRTEMISPGVHIDLNRQGQLIGIEVLDASEILQHKLQFEVTLTSPRPETITA